MSDNDDPRAVQQRNLQRNNDQANSPASRGIVRQEIESALREVGVNLAEWESIQDFRATMDFARDLRRKSQEAGNESRKGLINAVWAAIIALIGGGLGTFFTMKNGGH